MITIRAHFEDGNSLTTGFNGTEAEARAYYVGQKFELDERQGLIKCVSIEII